MLCEWLVARYSKPYLSQMYVCNDFYNWERMQAAHSARICFLLYFGIWIIASFGAFLKPSLPHITGRQLAPLDSSFPRFFSVKKKIFFFFWETTEMKRIWDQSIFYSFIESWVQIYGFQTKWTNRLGFDFQIALHSSLEIYFLCEELELLWSFNNVVWRIGLKLFSASY